MHTPKPTHLPSGRWYLQVRVKGNPSVSVTRDTERECIAAAMAIRAGLIKATRTPVSARTLADATDAYIRERENILSPSTIAGYRVIARNRFPGLQQTRVCDITPQRWQSAVNLEAKRVSAKTLKNSTHFIQSVIAASDGEKLSARLPQVVANELPWLTAEQIPVFLQAIHGNPYEIPALLALSGLRQSEIVALRWNDIDLSAGTICVHGAAVKADDGEIVFKKENKNASSRRTVPFLIPQLRDAIVDSDRNGEYVYPIYSTMLRRNINKVCQDAGLPEVGVHGLRRSFASLCYHLQIPEEITMRAGGWSNLTTMRKIYTKISEADMQTQAERFAQFFENADEIAHDL